MSSFSLVLFAGGLGSRLRDSESLPKPLVKINGLSLVSRIILQFHSTGIFNEFVLLTCLDDSLFRSTVLSELPDINIRFCNEENRSGRVGALLNYINQSYSSKSFFIANADTLFKSLTKSQLLMPIQNLNSSYEPLVYLAEPDKSRDDYYAINTLESTSMQNSGLSFISSEWLLSQTANHPSFTDTDDLLFDSSHPPSFSSLNTNIFDAGTPERLSFVRSLFK